MAYPGISCRLETLPAYDEEELEAIGNPVACLTVYIGTHGSNVVYDVGIFSHSLEFFD